ncbi:trehalase family glycosidase [Streptomyces sp. NPDC056938]|uniref:alpha-L-rhamnosidase-related protein n=1 Tax=unclassified Streptomyces TaxID=2593676 RepID=UPI00362CD2CB
MTTWKRRHRTALTTATSAALLAMALLAPQAADGATAPGAAFSGALPSAARHPWDVYNYSPQSRTLKPVAIHSTVGSVTDASAALSGKSTRLSGTGSAVTFDFGKDVSGLVTLHFAASDGPQRVGLAFNESSQYVGTTSDASTGGPRSRDGALYADVDGATTYTMPAKNLRGGFRYLTVFMDSAGSADLDGITAHFTAAPKMQDPRAYANYFYSSDDLLNRIWYAGAYTIQLNTIAPKTGRLWEAPAQTWDNTGDVGVGDTILVDGAKRDRTVWPGDLGVEIPSAYAAFDDTESARNALTTLYQHQKITGELPYSGPMMNKYGSDTYHMWTLAASWDYYRYTGDRKWVDGIWDQYKRGVDYIGAKTDDQGLLSITETADSVRSLPKGENLIANVLMWRVLTTGSQLAKVEGDTTLAQSYAHRAAALRTAIDSRLWDEEKGAYRFYPDSDVHAQDGNALAVWYGLADQSKARRISSYLTTNWNDRGSTSPENKGNLGVFAGSMEVNAHFAAGGTTADQAGVDLIRRQWGAMLDDPLGTRSTFWESSRPDGCICSTYVSLAHAWATGPTTALTFSVLGLQPTSAGGRAFDFVPHTADLTFAQGRITTTLGPVDASWRVNRKEGKYRAELTAPKHSEGRVAVPTFGRHISVFVDGKLAWNGRTAKAYDAHTDGEYVYLEALSGHHVIDSHQHDS